MRVITTIAQQLARVIHGGVSRKERVQTIIPHDNKIHQDATFSMLVQAEGSARIRFYNAWQTKKDIAISEGVWRDPLQLIRTENSDCPSLDLRKVEFMIQMVLLDICVRNPFISDTTTFSQKPEAIWTIDTASVGDVYFRDQKEMFCCARVIFNLCENAQKAYWATAPRTGPSTERVARRIADDTREDAQ